MAAEKMKSHIDTTIPTVHSMCIDGLKLTLKKAWDSIYDKDGKDRELRPSELTQKLSLIAALYKKIYDMTTESSTLTRAMEIVRLEKERLRILEERYGSTTNEDDIANLVSTQEIRELQESIDKLEEDTEAEEEEEEEIEVKEDN